MPLFNKVLPPILATTLGVAISVYALVPYYEEQRRIALLETKTTQPSK